MRIEHTMSHVSRRLVLLLIIIQTVWAPIVAHATSCIDNYSLQPVMDDGEAIPPLTSISNFDHVKSQEMLDEYVRQSNDVLQKGLAKLRAMDPAFDPSVISLQPARKKVVVKNGTEKYKASYLELKINGSKISPKAKSRVAAYLRRLARLHPDMRVYLSPIVNKSMGTYGFFDPSLTTELALFLDETSVKNFTLDQPFDDTILHEGRHLAYEDSRRRGLPPTVYDYGLETANGKRASYLEGYEDYLSFEEFYSWFRDLMSAILDLRDPSLGVDIAKKLEEIDSILESLEALVVDRKETGIIVFRQKLKKADIADVTVRITKKSGVEVTVGDYSLSNLHPNVINKFKSIAHTTEGKKQVVAYFLDDLNKFEKAMLGARKDLPDVREALEDLKAFEGTPAQIREYAAEFEQYVHWVNRHFDGLRN